MTENFAELGYQEIRQSIENGKISLLEIVEVYLDRIQEQEDLNAFLSVYTDEVRQQAIQIDQKIREKRVGKLGGMVVAVKDVLALKGKITTCGSKILENFVSPYNATVIDRLIARDALIIGKTNMDEFAMGSSNENSYFGAVKNPVDKMRVPGGSSGGSAVAVATGMAAAALGSDTGGSVRQPASLCGVVGIKPSYGRVSRFGLISFAPSLDQVGVFAKNVEDCAQVLQSIAGHDSYDSTSAATPVPDYSQNIHAGVHGLKIAFPKEFLAQGIQLEIKKSIQAVLDFLDNAGARVEEVTLPNLEYAIAAYYILATAEASSNLARFDGAKYGFRAENNKDLAEMYEATRVQGFGEEVKRRIMLGTYVLSAGYYEAYYRKAQKARTIIKQDFDQTFQSYDAIIAPVAPTTAFKLGEKIDDPLQMYLSDIYTIPANLAGINGLSLPCGVDSNGLPIGVQVLTKAFNESMTFRIANFLENEYH